MTRIFLIEQRKIESTIISMTCTILFTSNKGIKQSFVSMTQKQIASLCRAKYYFEQYICIHVNHSALNSSNIAKVLQMSFTFRNQTFCIEYKNQGFR